MDQSNIDKYIILVADALSTGFDKDAITKDFVDSNFAMDEIWLLLKAGTILYENRLTLPIRKPSIRRVHE